MSDKTPTERLKGMRRKYATEETIRQIIADNWRVIPKEELAKKPTNPNCKYCGGYGIEHAYYSGPCMYCFIPDSYKKWLEDNDNVC